MPRLVYERIYWEDAPSINTPLSAENLNNMDNGLASLYADVGDLEGNLDTLITSDLVPTEVYDENEQGYIATHNYAIGDTMILSSPNETKNCRAFEAISIGAEIVSVTQQEYADLENMLFAGSTPNVVEIPQGDAVVEAISKYVEIDQNVVRKSDIINDVTMLAIQKALDARIGALLAGNFAYVEHGDDPNYYRDSDVLYEDYNTPYYVAKANYYYADVIIIDGEYYKIIDNSIAAGEQIFPAEPGITEEYVNSHIYAEFTPNAVNIPAGIENSVATKQYAAGDYLVLAGQLFIATASIATGDPIVIGENVEETSIANELAVRPRIETGIKDVTFTSGSTYVDHTITFSEPFKNVPKVFTQVRTRTDIQTNVPVFALDIASTSQFTIRVWKQVGAGTSGMAPQIHWMAVGI